MKAMSRRKLFATGGGAALTAAGLAAASRGEAASVPWTWAPTASMAGDGTGVDPAYVWDPDADSVAEWIYKNNKVAEVNDALAGWRTNGQATPDALPSIVKDFVDRARKLPDWADKDKLAKGGLFQEKKGTFLTIINTMGSGMLSTAIPLEARSVYYSAGGANMRDRVAKTTKMGADLGEPDPFGDNGFSIVSNVKTRMVHAAVRHLLPQSPHWTGDIPISNRDILVTWHTLPTYTMRTLKSWGANVPDDEADGYLHAWQVTAKLFGVQEEYIPATWEAANAQSDQLLPPAMGPTPEGVALTEVLLDLASELMVATQVGRPIVNAIARYCAGEQVSTWDQIPENALVDASVKAAWPGLVKLWDGVNAVPGTPPLTYILDEALRDYAQYLMSNFKQINISLPTGNNPDA